MDESPVSTAIHLYYCQRAAGGYVPPREICHCPAILYLQIIQNYFTPYRIYEIIYIGYDKEVNKNGNDKTKI